MEKDIIFLFLFFFLFFLFLLCFLFVRRFLQLGARGKISERRTQEREINILAAPSIIYHSRTDAAGHHPEIKCRIHQPKIKQLIKRAPKLTFRFGFTLGHAVFFYYFEPFFSFSLFLPFFLLFDISEKKLPNQQVGRKMKPKISGELHHNPKISEASELKSVDN